MLTVPVIHDSEFLLFKAYGTYSGGLPSAVVIDEAGKVEWSAAPGATLKELLGESVEKGVGVDR